MRGCRGLVFWAFLVAVTNISSLAALEPLPVVLQLRPAGEPLPLPSGFESRFEQTVVNRIYALGRFEVVQDLPGASSEEPKSTAIDDVRETYSEAPEIAEAAVAAATPEAATPEPAEGVHTLEYGIISFSEDQVWVPYEEDEEEEEEDDGGVIGAVLTFFFPAIAESNEAERGRWMTEAQVTIDVRLLAPPGFGKDRAFSLSAYAREESPVTAHNTLLHDIGSSMDMELRRLYVLRGRSQVARRYGTIDFGSEVGVRSGQLFSVRSDSAPGSVTLLRVLQPEDGWSDVQVVRQWGTRDANGAVRERIGPAFDVRVDTLADIDKDGSFRVGPALTVVAAPYAPLHGGGGMRFFGVEDSSERLDFGFAFSAFVGAHVVALPRFRLTAVGTGELGIVTRPDDNKDSASTLIPAFAPELQASIVITPHLDVLIGGGYRFAATTTDWTVTPDVEDAEAVSAHFVDDAPSVTTTGAFAYAGMRFVAF